MNLRPEEISSVIKEQIKRYSTELEVSETSAKVILLRQLDEL